MKRIVLVITVGVMMTALAGAAAFAQASDAAAPASCMGHEASAISPPGSSKEFPGGRPALETFIRENFPGTPPGAVKSQIAKLHEGSHEACDEALAE